MFFNFIFCFFVGGVVLVLTDFIFRFFGGFVPIKNGQNWFKLAGLGLVRLVSITTASTETHLA